MVEVMMAESLTSSDVREVTEPGAALNIIDVATADESLVQDRLTNYDLKVTINGKTIDCRCLYLESKPGRNNVTLSFGVHSGGGNTKYYEVELKDLVLKASY